MKYLSFTVSVLLLLTTGLNLSAQTKAAPKGALFIIGGGSRSEALIKQLVATARMSAKDYIPKHLSAILISISILPRIPNG
jgi:hypothetical protein